MKKKIDGRVIRFAKEHAREIKSKTLYSYIS